MKIKNQVLIAIVGLVVVLGWAFFQLVLPWLQRTFSDPEIAAGSGEPSLVVNQLVLDVVEPPRTNWQADTPSDRVDGWEGHAA